MLSFQMKTKVKSVIVPTWRWTNTSELHSAWISQGHLFWHKICPGRGHRDSEGNFPEGNVSNNSQRALFAPWWSSRQLGPCRISEAILCIFWWLFRGTDREHCISPLNAVFRSKSRTSGIKFVSHKLKNKNPINSLLNTKTVLIHFCLCPCFPGPATLLGSSNPQEGSCSWGYPQTLEITGCPFSVSWSFKHQFKYDPNLSNHI